MDKGVTGNIRQAFWGSLRLLRVFSGLAGVIMLGTIALNLEEIAAKPHRAMPSAPSERPPEATILDRPPAPTASVTRTNTVKMTPSITFYLVETPEQAAIAEWGEAMWIQEAMEANSKPPDHRYFVLFASSEKEELLATQIIAERVAGFSQPTMVHLIDLRN